MKKIHTIILLLVLPAAILRAQKPIGVFEENLTIAGSAHPGITVTIPEVGAEMVQENWLKTIQTGTKSKAVFENGEWTLFGANIKSISETPINIYSRIIDQDSVVRVMASFELKKDVYVEKNVTEAELVQAKSFMKQFAKDQYLAYANAELQAEEKKLIEIEKELRSFQREESGLERNIRKSENTIKSENEKIAAMNAELATVSAELVTQNEQLGLLPEGEARDEMLKTIRGLEKQQKKLMNSIEASGKKINKANSAIVDSNARIPQQESLQNSARDRIAAQEAVVRRYEDKVKVIKAY